MQRFNEMKHKTVPPAAVQRRQRCAADADSDVGGDVKVKFIAVKSFESARQKDRQRERGRVVALLVCGVCSKCFLGNAMQMAAPSSSLCRSLCL